MTELSYSTLPGRPPGRLITLAARALPGVRAVQEQVEPFAAGWERHNAAALAATRIGAPSRDRGRVGQLAARHPAWRVVNLAASGGRVRDRQLRIPLMRRWTGRPASDRFRPNERGCTGMAGVFDAVVPW